MIINSVDVHCANFALIILMHLTNFNNILASRLLNSWCISNILTKMFRWSGSTQTEQHRSRSEVVGRFCLPTRAGWRRWDGVSASHPTSTPAPPHPHPHPDLSHIHGCLVSLPRAVCAVRFSRGGEKIPRVDLRRHCNLRSSDHIHGSCLRPDGSRLRADIGPWERGRGREDPNKVP